MSPAVLDVAFRSGARKPRGAPPPTPLSDELSSSMPAVKSGETHLTRQQLRVLVIAARGYTASAIAIELGLSEQTVKNHLGAVYKAVLGQGGGGLVATLHALGWIRVPDQAELVARFEVKRAQKELSRIGHSLLDLSNSLNDPLR